MSEPERARERERAPARALWREEVSIHESEERFVGRRQLGKFLVLTSLGMFVGNLWILLKAKLGGSGAAPARPVRIAGAGDLAPGEVKLFAYPTPSDACLLVRTRSGELHAYSQKCTHLSCAVVYRPERERLECPCHHGAFSVRTGAVLYGPPPRPLPRIRLAVHGSSLYAVGVTVRSDRDEAGEV